MKKKFLVLVFVLLFARILSAQERGQYIPGLAGLNSGHQAPPGWLYANYLIWYPTDRFNDRNGDEALTNFDLDLIVDLNVVAYTSKAKLLGATYGFSVGIPISNTAISLPFLANDITTFGLADIYVEPINLGWSKPHEWYIKAAYGFMAPTGKFDEHGTETTTTDYWGHEFTLAGTRALGQTKLWQLSVSSNWEFHQTKRHEDVKVGNNMTLEYGFGKTIIHNQGKQLFQLGVVGYGEFQLTEDSGADVTNLNRGSKDHVFALGGEFGIIWPANKFNLMVRVIPEFGAHSRTQGLTFVAAVAKGF